MTPSAPSRTSTAPASCSDWRTELSLDEAIASALAWGEKRQEILGYE